MINTTVIATWRSIFIFQLLEWWISPMKRKFGQWWKKLKRIRRNTDMWRKKKKGVTSIFRDYTNSSKKILTGHRHFVCTLFFAADDSRRKTCTLLRKYSVSACGMRRFCHKEYFGTAERKASVTDSIIRRYTCTLLWKYSVSACGMRLRQPQRIFRNGGKENFGYW